MRLPPETVLPTLTIAFGLQILRTLWPYLRYLLYSRFELSPVQAGFIGLAIKYLAKVASDDRIVPVKAYKIGNR